MKSLPFLVCDKNETDSLPAHRWHMFQVQRMKGQDLGILIKGRERQ
jgi:hypothetical protein